MLHGPAEVALEAQTRSVPPVPAQCRGLCSPLPALLSPQAPSAFPRGGPACGIAHHMCCLGMTGRSAPLSPNSLSSENKYTEAPSSRRTVLKNSFTAKPQAALGGRGSRSHGSGGCVPTLWSSPAPTSPSTDPGAKQISLQGSMHHANATILMPGQEPLAE